MRGTLIFCALWYNDFHIVSCVLYIIGVCTKFLFHPLKKEVFREKKSSTEKRK